MILDVWLIRVQYDLCIQSLYAIKETQSREIVRNLSTSISLKKHIIILNFLIEMNANS